MGKPNKAANFRKGHGACSVIVAVLVSISTASSYASSSLAFSYNYHSGPEDNSFSTGSSYAGIVTAEGGENAFRISYGIGGVYGQNFMFYNTGNYATTTFGGEVRIGFSVRPLDSSFFSPIFTGHGIAGANVYKLSSPPSGAPSNQMNFSWGYEGEAGMIFPIGSKKLRLSGAYRSIRSKYNSTTINLDAMAFRLALEF